MNINVGTRGSKLALAQTNYVINRLKEKYPEHEYKVVVITTTGDKDLESPLDQIGSKGVFVGEIEQALLRDDIQLAIHSMKDMPSVLADDLCFSKTWTREDPRDALILKGYSSLFDLPKGAVIATGSKRRSYQLLKLRPDLKIVNIRGNIDTRLKKLEEGLSDGTRLDGIVLAAAGLKRLNFQDKITEYFDIEDMVPSPAQGTLAIELRSDNLKLKEMVDSLSDSVADDISFLERGFLLGVGGDCHLPIGAYARKLDEGYELTGLFGNEAGTKLARTKVTSNIANQRLIDTALEDITRQMKELDNE